MTIKAEDFQVPVNVDLKVKDMTPKALEQFDKEINDTREMIDILQEQIVDLNNVRLFSAGKNDIKDLQSDLTTLLDLVTQNVQKLAELENKRNLVSEHLSSLKNPGSKKMNYAMRENSAGDAQAAMRENLKEFVSASDIIQKNFIKKLEGETTEAINKITLVSLEQERQKRINASNAKGQEESARQAYARKWGTDQSKVVESLNKNKDKDPYFRGTITREDVRDLEEYTKAMNALQSKAKSLRDFQEVQKKALNREEDEARKQTETAIKNGADRGIKYTQQEIQQMFEAFSLNDYIKKVGDTLKRGVGVDDKLEFLSRSTYPAFIGDQGRLVSNFYKTEEGTIVPKTSLRPNGDRLKYSPFPEYNDLNGKTLNYIAEYYNSLIEDGSENALKYAKNIRDAIVEAYQNSASNSVKQDFERKLSQLIPDTDDFLLDSPFWRELRAQTRIGTQMDDVSWIDEVRTSKTEVERQADKEKEDVKTKNKIQKAETIVSRQLDGINTYLQSQEFRNLILTALSGGLVTDENGKTVDYSEFTPNQLRDTISTILNQSYIQNKSNAELDFNKIGSVNASGLGERYDSEAVSRAKEVDQQADYVTDNYKKVLDILYNTFNELYQNTTAENQAKLEPTMKMLELRKNGSKSDAKQLVNALSNYTTYGGVIQDSWVRFSNETGLDSSINDTLGWLDESVKLKVADSIKINNEISEILTTALSDLQANINNTNLVNSKNKEISNLANEILNWNVDDLFENLSRIEVFQTDFAEDAKSGSLGKFYKARTQLNSIFDELGSQLFGGFTSLQNEDRDFNNIIEGIKQFKDDIQSFYLFLKQFYSETYGIGASSINFNEEEAEKQRRGIQRPVYSKSPGYKERSPKQRYIGATSFMDVLGLYGASDVDTGIEIAGKRLNEYEQKLSEETEDRKYALEVISRVDEEIEKNQKIISEIAQKYPGHDSKSEIGGWKVDWEQAKDPALGGGIPLSEIRTDKRSFEKAQDRISRLKGSEDYINAVFELDRIDSGKNSESLKKAIEIIKEDILYLKRAKEYIEESINDTKFGKQLALPEKGSITVEDQKWQENLQIMSTPRSIIDSGDVIELGDNVKKATIALQDEEYQVEDLNKDLNAHEQMTQDATQAESAKMAVSADLVKQLLQEAKAYEQVTESAKKETEEAEKVQTELEEIANNKKSGDISITGFIPDFDEDLHQYSDPKTGEKFYSITQLRDALIRGQNPTFGIDIENIKKKAASNMEKGLRAISVDDFEGMKPDDFKFMVEDVIGQGLRGDVFHSLIDKMVKSGSTTMEELEKNDNEAFKKWQNEYKQTVKELASYGIGEEFLEISERLESYMDAMKKSGLSATEFSEQRLAFNISGARGNFKVGVTPDQFYSMNGKGAFIDNKTGSVHGQEAFQLTAQLFATLANLDNEVAVEVKNLETGAKELKKIKVKDLLGDLDLTTPIKGYIADVGDGITELKEYALMNLKEFYDLIADAVDIKEGRKAPLSKEERNRRMNRQLKTGTTIGYSDSKYAESVNEELMFIDANQGKLIREYVSQLSKVKALELEIQNINAKSDEYSEADLDREVKKLDALQKQKSDIESQMASLNTVINENGKQYILGNSVLDEDHSRALENQITNITNLFETKSITALNKIEKRMEQLTAKDTSINTGLFGEDFDTIVQKLKDGYTEIDRTQESLSAKVKAYEASLRSEVSALKDIATHSTKIQSINEQIDKLQADNSTENSELLNDLNKRLKKEQELLKVAEQRRDVAIQERQGTGLDEDIASGKVDAQTKQRIANTYSQQRQNLVNAVNQGTAKAEADQSVQNYVQANKLIKEYINNLKLQYKTQQEIQKLSIKMENQSGNELAASEAYKAALESRVDSLQEQLPYYDQQSKKLGNIKLEEEQIVSLEKQKNNLAKQQQIAQEKINATVKDQRNILEEIVGGFKQAFRNMTDASIAYEIIGMFRQGVTELLQTIREMDSALVDLQIASGGTREEMHDMMMDLNSLATEVGKTTTEVAQGANDWLRAGYEGQEAADLTRASMQLSTLGMIDSADATSYLISVLKGWKLEASEVATVVDKLVAVDMSAALSAGDLAEAIVILSVAHLKYSPLYRVIIQ